MTLMMMLAKFFWTTEQRPMSSLNETMTIVNKLLDNEDPASTSAGSSSEYDSSGCSDLATTNEIVEQQDTTKATEKTGLRLSDSANEVNVTLQIGNVPWHLNPSDVQQKFSKWGKCKLEGCAPEQPLKSFRVLMSFNKKESEWMEALHHGNRLRLQGQQLAVHVWQPGTSDKREEPFKALVMMGRMRRRMCHNNYSYDG